MTRYRSLKSPHSLKSTSSYWCAALALMAATAHAGDSNWQMHGALTQGVIYTSDNNFYGPSDDSLSWKFTEITLNGSARLLPNVRASGQVLYRQAAAQGESGGVDYAMLDYQFVTESAYTAGVRAGRYKLPIGLYNETRDIAFTRPSIYMPQSAYPDRGRDLALSADGVLLYTDIFTNSGQWTIELDGGHPRVDKHTVEAAFDFIPGQIDELGKRTTYGGRVMYQSSDGMWLAAFSRLQARLHYTQTLPPALFDVAGPSASIDVNFIYWIASLQCNIDQWTFTGEYGHIDIGLESTNVSFNLHPLFYYLQATRHIDKHWSIYSRYDNLYWDRRDPSGDDYAALNNLANFAETGGSALITPAFANFAHDYGFGVRYDIDSNAMLSAEYHYIDGGAWLTGLNGTETPVRYWNMVAVEFSYRF